MSDVTPTSHPGQYTTHSVGGVYITATAHVDSVDGPQPGLPTQIGVDGANMTPAAFAFAQKVAASAHAETVAIDEATMRSAATHAGFVGED